MNFLEFGLQPQLLRSLDRLGYERPTPIQAEAIPEILAGGDLIGNAQTGTGKTAAFALPMLDRLLSNPLPRRARRWIRALIVTPTRELAAQIGQQVRQFSRGTRLRTCTIFGGVSQRSQVQELEAGVDVVIATPGRLLDLVGQRALDLRDVEVFVLDEADQMLDMGFLPDVRRIAGLLPPDRQTLMFSATMPTAIRSLADQLLQTPKQISVTPVGSVTELVDQRAIITESQNKSRLLAELIEQSPQASMLVFARTKHGADQLVRRLNKVGIDARAIHGNKSQSNRQKTLAGFTNREFEVLVATDIAARGIDISGIEYVINYDLPADIDTYVHRIGRTGRAGERGIAVTFCATEEQSQLQRIAQRLKTEIAMEDRGGKQSQSQE